MTSPDSKRPLFTPPKQKVSDLQQGFLAVPLTDQSPCIQNSMLAIPMADQPPKYTNDGYMGSKSTVSKSLDDSHVELGIIMDTGMHFFHNKIFDTFTFYLVLINIHGR